MSNLLYCQVVFGQNADLRVWLIVDRHTVYLDRAGGDAPRMPQCPDEEKINYPIELTDSDGRTRYTITSASRVRDESRPRLHLAVQISGPVEYAQYGFVELVDDASQARIAHVHGPLTIQAVTRAVKSPWTLTAGGAPQYIQAMVTTARQGSWVAVRSERRGESAFPPGIVPIADIDFPSNVARGPAVRRQFALNEFC